MTTKLSEYEFEQQVIRSLEDNGWTYRADLSNQTEEALLGHWRELLFENNIDRLNNLPLSDAEFEQAKQQIFDVKTPLEAYRLLSSGQLLISREIKRADGLSEKKEVALEFFWADDVASGQNRYEIVNQITRRKTIKQGQDHRFDVTLLISGVPVIHLELKRAGVSLEQAYWQIRDYVGQGDFGGFYSLVQLFAILNGDQSRYFARPSTPQAFNPAFCFGWADEKNQPISESSQFIKTALRVPMGHKLMSRYIIADQPKGILKVLRSYQIYAIENIIARLSRAKFSGSEQDIRGGYIWHTTGSGKTMTSFKAAQLATALKNVDKVVFLADRNDLVKQTIDEYSSFVVDDDDITSTDNSRKLLSALLSKQQNLIVSSIQKMDNVAKLGRQSKLDDTHIVFIVDEVHRSTFGEMLIRIREAYPTAIWFGFTGTPILDDNSKGAKTLIEGGKKIGATTASLFGDPLHVYSVAEGILEGNVLGFEVRQNFPINKRKLRNAIAEWKDPTHSEVYQFWLNKNNVSDLEIEQELSKQFYEKSEWYQQVSSHILENWQQNSYNQKFSAMLAVNDIRSANHYFKLLKDNPLGLKVAVLYDVSIDYGEDSLQIKEDFMAALAHYKELFGKEFSLESVSEYKDDLINRLSRRYEYRSISSQNNAQQLDLIIVVWQLLTGFDAPYLNTLYLDKILDYANLIQAFSRTNRILGNDKPQGIIEYYRQPIQMALNIEKAFTLYSNKNSSGAFFVPTKAQNFEKINRIFADISLQFSKTLDCEPDFSHLPEEIEAKKQFARFFNELERTMICLRQQGFSWDNAKETENLTFSEEQYKQLQARYADLEKENKDPSNKEKFDIVPDLVSGDTTNIDKNYLSTLLTDIAEATVEETQKIEKQILSLFNQMRENDRQLALQILNDVKAGKIKSPNFQTLLEQYRFNQEEGQIKDFIDLFGLNRQQFNKLQAHHILGQDDWKDFGLLDSLIQTANMELVTQQFIKEKPTETPNKIKLKGFLTMKIKQEVEKVILSR